MSEESKPFLGLRINPHAVDEFNASVRRIFTAMAQVPQRMAALERERLERQRDDQA
jgi:hypothetical protein